jgi:hypothetical protein
MSIAEKLLTIAENEQRVYDAGYEKGKAEGGGGDTDAAFEAGRQAAWDEFWDATQWKGKRTIYSYTFAGVGWNGNIFYPKYDLIITNGNNAFANFDDGENPFSLIERLNECGAVFDTTKNESFGYMFSGSPFTDIPFLDTSKGTAFSYTFRACYHLKTVSMSLKADGSQTWSNAFYGCNALVNFTITSGTIGKNGFDIHYSTELSKESLKSILLACNKANAGVTVTLPKKCVDGNQDTLTVITTDTELNTAYINATQVNNYTITFA